MVWIIIIILVIAEFLLMLWALSLNDQLGDAEDNAHRYHMESIRLQRELEDEKRRLSMIFKERSEEQKLLEDENRELRQALKQKELALSQKWANAR